MRVFQSGNVRYDLGIKDLFPQWRALFTFEGLKEDALAGLTVACVSIPLSLAIALASGVPPAAGLVTAVLAGIIGALFGGSPLSVSGPAAAMAVLISDDVDQFGITAVAVMCLICGLMQLVTGALGFGRIARYIPSPVVSGFTAGIGVIIILGQLPRLLGVTPPAQADTIDILVHLSRYWEQSSGRVVMLAILGLCIMHYWPKLTAKIPAAPVALVIPSLVAWIYDTQVPFLDPLPQALFESTLAMPTKRMLVEIIPNAIAVYFTASITTILTCSAIDEMTGKGRFDPNQEMIGQGLSNLAVSICGGVPGAGIIVRSAVNIKSGARSRRAAIFHSLFILAAVLLLGPLLQKIPIVALASVLTFIGVGMVDFKIFRNLWQVARGEALIFLLTFITIVFVDLLVGIQAGVGAALFIILINVSQTNVVAGSYAKNSPSRLTLTGSLNFLSLAKIEEMLSQFKNTEAPRDLIIDATQLTSMDTSGAKALLSLGQSLKDRSVRAYLKGITNANEQKLRALSAGVFPFTVVVAETDVEAEPEAIKARLLHGIDWFNKSYSADRQDLFAKLASGQAPHTLFITCSDSRINPNLITSTEPGELFVVRNVGNIIPENSHMLHCGESAAIEFAVVALKIKNIIICGHSACGAVKAAVKGVDASPDIPSLRYWLRHIELENNPDHQTSDSYCDEAAKGNTIAQVRNILTYRVVAEGVERGEISVSAWFYDVGKATILEWNEEMNTFVPPLFSAAGRHDQNPLGDHKKIE